MYEKISSILVLQVVLRAVFVILSGAQKLCIVFKQSWNGFLFESTLQENERDPTANV